MEQQRLAHEREVAWQDKRDRLAREVQIAKPLDDALVETQRRVSGELVPKGESHWAHAHREWEQIEGKIVEAEQELRDAQAEMQNQEGSSSAAVMQARYDAVLAAQAKVDQLYARWAELESKTAG